MDSVFRIQQINPRWKNDLNKQVMFPIAVFTTHVQYFERREPEDLLVLICISF